MLPLIPMSLNKDNLPTLRLSTNFKYHRAVRYYKESICTGSQKAVCIYAQPTTPGDLRVHKYNFKQRNINTC